MGDGAPLGVPLADGEVLPLLDAVGLKAGAGEALALAPGEMEEVLDAVLDAVPTTSDDVLLAVLEAVADGVLEGDGTVPEMTTLSSRKVPPAFVVPLPTSRKAKPAALAQAVQLEAKEAEKGNQVAAAPVEITVAGLVSWKVTPASTLYCKLTEAGPVLEW